MDDGCGTADAGFYLKGVVLTVVGAGAAFDASLGVEQELCLRRPAFGIVAPTAAQRASLEKDRGADPWTVMQTIALDLKQHTRLLSFHFPAKIG